eukprot:9158429-Lingulodinium_polyedra.AAC.1
MVSTIRATKCLPVQCIINHGFQITKKVMPHNTTSTIADGVRTVHCYPAFSQIVIRAVLSMREQAVNPDDMFGCIQGGGEKQLLRSSS